MTVKSSLRSLVYQTEKLTQRLRFVAQHAPQNGWPILLGVSFPKSGTHLLDQILLGLSQVAPFSKRIHSFYAEYEGESGIKRAPEQALRWLDSLRPCDIASAHLFARPEAAARVCSPCFVPYFIFRDPRDVVVSHVFYVTDMDKAVAYLRRHGVEVLGDPSHMSSGASGGLTWVYFLAPWGMQLELVSYPNGLAYEKTSKEKMWSPL